MKIVAVLIWYDEDLRLLYENVRSWARLCDAVVAIDGAFEGYPSARGASESIQREMIQLAAQSEGMECLTVSPSHVWPNHMEKRSFALSVAETLTVEDDWYFLLDADERLCWPPTPRAFLRRLDGDVASVKVELDDVEEPVRQPRLMRAIRGLRVEDIHYRYVTPDGRVLWDYPDAPQEEALPTSLRLHHRRQERGPIRNAAAAAYYRARDEAGTERIAR